MTAPILFLDFETCSPVDLNKCGVEVYAEHPETRVLCMAWAFDNGPIHGALEDDPEFYWLARNVFDHVRAGGLVVAHNAPFELAIWRMMHRREPDSWPHLPPDVWPDLRPEQTYCTMAQCRVLSLPGALEKAAAALRLRYQKDKDGHRLMLRLCKPRKPRKNEPQDALFWDHHTPDALARLLEYCKADIGPEREIFYLLPQLTERERAYWIIDRCVNDRGVGLDRRSIQACAAATARAQAALKDELQAVTAGYVPSASATAKFLEWLGTRGCHLPNLQRATVEKALEREDLTLDARRALEIRQHASKASTAKLNAMLNGICADGRARGLLEYHGTSTGRPAGRRIQPTNMLRPPKGFKVADAEDAFAWLAMGADRIVAAQHGSVINAVAYGMRCLIQAAPGHRLIAADYSNIEGRMLAWLAGEDWKLDAFRRFDAGEGHDLYKLAFAKAFGIPPEAVDDEQRQIGKVMELALQYGGAHGAFVSMAKNYAIDLPRMAVAVKAAVPLHVWDAAEQQYWAGAKESAEEILAQRETEARVDAWHGEEPNEYEPDFFNLMSECAKANRYGLSADVWAAIRIIVDGWRAAHPETTAFWYELNDAALAAVEQPGTVTRARRIQYAVSGSFLMCRLPSGRTIAYPYPRIEMEEREFQRDDGSTFTKRYPRLVFDGVDSKTRKWRMQRVWAGLLAENVTQAAARCIQSDSHHRLEAAGYPIVLHVYDENVCELPDGRGSLEELCAIMAASEPWADGLPVAVAGWSGFRYRKG